MRATVKNKGENNTMKRFLAPLDGLAILLIPISLPADPGQAAEDFKIEDGYISLFNGKDLTGTDAESGRDAGKELNFVLG